MWLKWIRSCYRAWLNDTWIICWNTIRSEGLYNYLMVHRFVVDNYKYWYAVIINHKLIQSGHDTCNTRSSQLMEQEIYFECVALVHICSIIQDISFQKLYRTFIQRMYTLYLVYTQCHPSFTGVLCIKLVSWPLTHYGLTTPYSVMDLGCH